ncbi:MAG: thiamine phosphate synthase [Candidatus Aminicenantales bacterium]
MDRIDWRLCFIVDSEAAAGRDILQLVGEAVDGGATIIQLRGKKWTSRKFMEVGMKTVRFLSTKKIPLIINDRVDIALACEAHGVHLGQDDMLLPYAREILGKNRIIGISVNTKEEAAAAERGGADYIGAGPVFGTLSKENLGPFLGLEGLRTIREKVKIPILAIGGIAAANVADVISAGADGVAVISAIAAAANPKKAANEIFESIGKIKNSRR